MPPDEFKPLLRFRKLRIAWSVFWGIACVLVVRFHDNTNQVVFFNSLQLSAHGLIMEVESWQGQISLGFCNVHDLPTTTFTYHLRTSDGDRHHTGLFGLGYTTSPTGKFDGIIVRHSFWFFLFAIIGAAPWIGWRFSLRTLLIATMLVAVVLGFAVWAAR